MSRSAACALGLSSAAMLALQGCGAGGSGSGPSPTPAPAPTTTTTTTTTTITKGPEGFYYCEDISTFYRTFYAGVPAAKGGASQCQPSISPGAYYTKPGDLDPDQKSDKVWSCWNADTVKDLRNDAAARKAGFEGACLFKDYTSTTKPGDLKRCSTYLDHHPAVCTPGPSKYWGACYSEKTENWLCVQGNSTNIDGYAKGDCKAQVPVKKGTAEPEDYFFDGACTFAPDTTAFYKCDTVPGYDPELGSTCGQKLSDEYDKACFVPGSGSNDVTWSCVDEGTPFPSPCDWSLQPDGKSFYTAGCYFKQNKNYKDALDAHNLTSTVKSAVII